MQATEARSCSHRRRTIRSSNASPKASPSEAWGGIRFTASPNRKLYGKSTPPTCARNFPDRARSGPSALDESI
jgi:hypothetical protein